MDAQAISAAQAPSTAVSQTNRSGARGSSPTAMALNTNSSFYCKRLEEIKVELAGYSPEQIEKLCAKPLRPSSEEAIKIGKSLVIIRSKTARGKWFEKLAQLGIEPSMARRFMAIAIRYPCLKNGQKIIASTGSYSRLFELLRLSDSELEDIADGKTVRGISLNTVAEKSFYRVRSLSQNPVAPPTAEPIIAPLEDQTAADTTSFLQDGDRVQSLHAGRSGRVVRTYADGSACVCWDDGEPQAEGLGHERMPCQLLVRVSQEEAVVDAGKVSITREGAELISTVLMESLRKNGTKRLLSVEQVVESEGPEWIRAALMESRRKNGIKRLLSVEQVVDMLRHNDMIQSGDSAVSIDTIIRDLNFYGLHPDQLLTKEPVETQLGGGAVNTIAPFSGCIDPGNDLHVGHRPAVADQAGDLQVLPSVYSMTHGDFNGADVTLMIHASKTWMIAEEIAAVLGETPEQVAEIEEIIGQHFTAARIPEAYAKVRIASTSLTARLLDAYAIHVLDVVLDTPASSSLVAWMDGLAKTNDTAEASPLPTSEEPTLSQNFSQLEVLHGITWTMMDQVASQIGALRVVLMEQESEPGSVAKAIHPETLATVAANLLAEHNSLCDDMEMVTRQIHEQVFEKGESLPESVWLDLVVELSKERDALSREEAWKISSIATKLLPFANSSPEVGAALGNLVEFSRRNGAFLYHHEPTGTMTWQWLQGMNPALRKNASRQAH